MSNEPYKPQDEFVDKEGAPPEFRSLKDLIDRVSGKHVQPMDHEEDSGLASPVHFPFLAIVGQYEMKLALTLSLINPNIGGVLLLGPRGTGKSIAIHGLTDLLPANNVSQCFYGCMEEDIETGGMEAVCPDCAEKFANGKALSVKSKVHLVELPLNAKLENVIGGLDKRRLTHNRMRLKRGILSLADKNILFIDEINLLHGDIINAILDAAAMGRYTVRRGAVSATYKSRFVLIGSMNPDEGDIKPQIMDRFGLRILTRGLESAQDRLEAYTRTISFRNNPVLFQHLYEDETRIARMELDEARKSLPDVILPEDVAQLGLKLIRDLNIVSLRTEIALFETAKAYAAANRNLVVTKQDLATIAPLALRLRNSPSITDFFEKQTRLDNKILDAVQQVLLDGDL